MTLYQRLSTTLLVVATTIGATFTVLVAGGSGSLDLPAIRVIYLVMASVALVPWLAVAVVRPSWRPSSRLAPAIVVCLGIFAVSTLTSRVPRLSAEMLGYALLLIELYLLLVALMRRPALRLHFQRLALIMSVLVCALYLVEVFRAWLVWWDLVGHLAIPPLRPGYLGLFLSPNPIATVVLTLGAFGLAASGIGGRAGRVVTVAVAILALVVTFITGSRGAWLGAGLGVIAVFSAALLAHPENRRRAGAVLRSRFAVIALVVGIPLVTAAGVLAALSGRLSLDDGGFRAGFARASAQMFEASPLTGVGPGTWGVLRASNTIPTDPDLYIPHAHSVYVQTLAEFGLGGVVAGIAILAALGVLSAGAIRSEDPSRRRVGYATLFGVVLLAGQQFADVLMNVPAVLLALALPIAWLDAAAQPSATERPADGQHRSTRWGPAIPLGAAIATCVIIVGLARIEAVAGIASQGVQAANADAWAEATRLAGEAVAGDPDLNVYRFQLGVSVANAGDLQLAERSLHASATADDYRYAWLNLAAVRWKLGDPSGAREALARAERLGLQRTALAIAAGWLRQQLGDEQAATEDYATAVGQMPTLADDPFWTSPSGPRGGLTTILQAVQQRASPTTMLQIHLILGQLDLARQDVAALSPSDPDMYRLLIPAWEGDAEAWNALQAEAASRPLDPAPASWCRLIATYMGDEPLARKYRTWLVIATFPDSGLPIVGRLVFDSAKALPTYILDGYGTLYRRQVPSVQVVDLLPQVVLQDLPQGD